MVEQLCDVDNGYEELAYDLYKAGDSLLHDLVAVRKDRGMTQEQLADAMNVSCSVVKEIEDGETDLTSLLTDYALEVGARVEYKVEKAEDKHNSCVQPTSFNEMLAAQRSDGGTSIKVITVQVQNYEWEADPPSFGDSISDLETYQPEAKVDFESSGYECLNASK